MNMLDAVKSVLTQYVGFRGRARRSEYWYWTLATMIASIAINIFEAAIWGADGVSPLSGLLSLAIFLPGLAVTVRRLHDTGRSGWWIGGFYLGIIAFFLALSALAMGVLSSGGSDGTPSPYFGVFGIIIGMGFILYVIAMIVFLCTDSDVGPNHYGPNPKNEGNYDVFA